MATGRDKNGKIKKGHKLTPGGRVVKAKPKAKPKAKRKK